MNIEDEKKKILDQAAGQKQYVKQTLPSTELLDGDSETLKKKLLAICVTSYIDDAEKEKLRLLGAVEVEKTKNRDIKDIAERLAMELLRHEPEHELANATLALLLENKMMTPAQRKKK